MKKILIALGIAAVIGAVAAGLYINADYSFSFIDTYKQNFADNLFNLRLKIEEKKAQREENSENTADGVSYNEQEISDETSHTQQPKFEYEALTKKLVLSCDPIALSSASSARFEGYMDGILCVAENMIVFYNRDGKLKWSESIQLSNPILRVSGSYILLMEQNGTKLELYNGERKLFGAETKEKILTGNLSSNGDCAVITEKKYYKGAVTVYNKSGLEIFSRSFGTSSAVAAAISDSRRLCVSLLSSSGGISSEIMFLDIEKTEETAKLKYDDTVIFDLDFSGNTLYAFADNKLITLSSGGKEQWVSGFDAKTLSHYRKDSGNIRLLMFDNNNNAQLSVVNSYGKIKQNISTDIIPDFCDICDGYVIYNGGRSLYLTKLNGEPLAKYISSRDMQKAYFIDSENILIVYSKSIEFLRVKEGE